MAHLFDSNCFLRLADSQTAARRVVLGAIRKLRTANEAIFYTPQIIAEFWNVCTRPTSARGGLGLSVKQTELKVKVIEKHFRLLPDNLATFIEWRGLLSTYTVEGVQVHDAKIVASMLAYNIPVLVTFNTKDFQRYSAITVVDPKDI